MQSFRNATVVLALVLFGVSFPGASAFADGDHDGSQTTAEQAGSANDRETMESFVLHAKRHIDAAVAAETGSTAALYKQMREEGVWKDGSVYLIILRESGTVVNHGKYTKSLYGNSLAGIPVVKNLISEAGEEKPSCVEHNSKWVCAVRYTPAVSTAGAKNVLIGGFDHEEEADGIVSLVCPAYQPEVTAQDVSDSQYVSESHALETLESFVKESIKRFKARAAQDALVDRQKALDGVACWGRGPWKSGPIYLFIMSKPAEGAPTVVFNGNNSELTGSRFENVLDEDGVDVGEVILKAVETEAMGGIVRYKWDNPVIEEDDLSEVNMSPGRSPKISYVEALPGFGNATYIFGSGIYGTLEGDGGSSDGGDDGCAVAGTGAEPAGAVFSMFLAAFSLCLALWRRERSRK